MSSRDPTPTRSSLTAALGPRTGRVIGGRYRLVAPVAEGGMGAVWRAEHTSLGHAVAVKFLAGGSAAKADHRARFEREARIAAKIAEDCQHVVKVTDHGVEEDGTPWIVMELLHGEGLDRRLRREPRLPLAVAVAIVKQLARGLETAHRHGVVHRDLKPANVFLCSDLDVDDRARAGGLEEVNAKLLDFGVAKTLWEEDAPTSEGVVLGTLGYMSPEQLSGVGVIDARADVWALGAIAYRMIVGKPAFGVGTSQEIGARVASMQPTPPSQAVDGLPPALDAVLMRGLEKSPSDRFGAARELADALAKAAAVAAQERIRAEPPLESALQSTNDGAVVATMPSGKRRRALMVLAVAALLGVTLFTLARLVRSPSVERDRQQGDHLERSGASGQSAVAPTVPSGIPSAVTSSAMPSALTSSVVGPSAVSAASASASSGQPVPSGKAKSLPKVIDTWNKKDEL